MFNAAIFVRLLGCVWLFATPWSAACQVLLSFTISQSLLKFMSTELVMLTISSSVAHFSFCLQSFSASGYFPMSQLFSSGGRSTGASASASVLPMNIQSWFPEWTGWISLLSKGLAIHLWHPSTTIQKHQLFGTQLLYNPTLTSIHDYWNKHNFDYMDLCQQSDVSAF